MKREPFSIRLAAAAVLFLVGFWLYVFSILEVSRAAFLGGSGAWLLMLVLVLWGIYGPKGLSSEPPTFLRRTRR